MEQLDTRSRATDATDAPWKDPVRFRLNNFDFLRLFFAVLVILSHSYAIVRGEAAEDPLMRLTGGLTSFSLFALHGFFILSGFLIAGSWANSRTFGQYLLNRVVRIYPGFVAAMLVTALVAAPLAASPEAPVFSAKQMAKLAVQSAVLRYYDCPGILENAPFPHYINGSLWTIRYEFGCYLVLAAVAGVLLKRRVLMLALVATTVLAAAVARETGWSPDIGRAGYVLGSPETWLRFLSYFLAGAAFYSARDWIPHSGRWAAVSASAMVCASFLPHAVEIAMPVFWTYLLFWIGYHPRINLHKFGRYGDFSYGTYLYAFTIQQLLVLWFGPRLSPLGLFVLATPLSLLAGLLSWHVVEKPFLQLKAKRRRLLPPGEQPAVLRVSTVGPPMAAVSGDQRITERP